MKKDKGDYNAHIGQKEGVSKEHWEVVKNLRPKGDDSSWGAFNAKRPTEWPCMHVKTNECDY